MRICRICLCLCTHNVLIFIERALARNFISTIFQSHHFNDRYYLLVASIDSGPRWCAMIEMEM